MNDDPILRLPQAARMLGVSRTTLWRLYSEHDLLPPPIQLSPGRVGYRQSTLEEYLRRQETA